MKFKGASTSGKFTGMSVGCQEEYFEKSFLNAPHTAHTKTIYINSL